MEGRVSFYRYKPFIEELNSLQYDRIKRKVDHTATSSKDVSDAVCGSFWSCITSEYAQMYLSDPTFVMGARKIDKESYDNKLPADPRSNPRSWVASDYKDLDDITAILDNNKW